MNDKETKKKYNQTKDRSVIKIRLNAGEKSLLDIEMKKEEWENVSGYVKYKLFGWAPEEKIKKIIKKKNPDEIGILLFNELRELNNNLAFINFRYNKDMQQLFREEGVNPQAWIKATREPFINITDKIKRLYEYCRDISAELGIEKNDTYDEETIIDLEKDSEAVDRAAEELSRNRPVINSDDVAPKYI